MPQTPPPASRGRPSVSAWGLIEALAVLLGLATFTGFLGRQWWVFELTSHFRPHLAAGLFSVMVIWLLRQQWRSGAVWGVLAVVNLGVLMPGSPPASEAPPAGAARLRLLAVNVHTANERFDLVRELVVAQSPDVVLLMEVNQRWLDALAAFKGAYPHQLAEPREDNFGIALFSRLPMTNAAVLALGLAGVPSLVADLAVGGQRLHLLGTHPLPPGTAVYSALRNNQFAALADHVRGQAGPTVVLGDLNATPASPFFRDLLRDSGLRNTAPGWNFPGSWPAWLPLGKIPLDHCLVSPSLRVANRRFGPPVGGDHLPLLVELVIPPVTR